MGRFITEDPAKDGNNWYVYCRNNPFKYIDPTGMFADMLDEEDYDYDNDGLYGDDTDSADDGDEEDEEDEDEEEPKLTNKEELELITENLKYDPYNWRNTYLNEVDNSNLSYDEIFNEIYNQKNSPLEFLDKETAYELLKVISLHSKEYGSTVYFRGFNGGVNTSDFGSREPVFDGMSAEHSGHDVAGVPLGTPVGAAGAGKVIEIIDDHIHGNGVVVEHPNGYLSRDIHMNSVSVEVGQKVKIGQELGTVGSEGLYTTGPHQHRDIRNAEGVFIDATKMLYHRY